MAAKRVVTLWVVIGVVLGMLLFAGADAAMAGTVEANFQGLAHSRVFDRLLSGSSQQVRAGVYGWQRTGGTHITEPTGTYYAVCIELDQLAGGTMFDVVLVQSAPMPGIALGAGPMGPTTAEDLAKFWAAHWADATTNDDSAAAFQVGVWEIIYDADMDLFAGEFQADYASLAAAPTFVQTAQTWLDGLPALTETADLAALSNPDYQDMLVLVPEPATVGLVILGGWVLARRRTA